MLIQVNTDDNIEGREKLVRYVEVEVSRILSRFSDQITRAEVHLSDETGDKPGNADKRCLMEARLAGRPPVAVSHEGATLEDAWIGAAKKLLRLLESTLGRVNDRKGGASIRTDDIVE
jgi:ribosome-associated translation inhibitor RaiA